MSTSKSAGASKLGRDSQPKYLGIKLFGGQKTKIGSIILRQRGTRFVAGKNTAMGGDNTVYALKEGVVSYKSKKKIKFDGSRKLLKVVNVN